LRPTVAGACQDSELLVSGNAVSCSVVYALPSSVSPTRALYDDDRSDQVAEAGAPAVELCDRCGSACVDLASNAEHCGACDHVVPSDAACVDGDIVCDVGTLCPTPGGLAPGEGYVCVDLTEDDAHCGACNAPCQEGPHEGTCADSQCEYRFATLFVANCDFACSSEGMTCVEAECGPSDAVAPCSTSANDEACAGQLTCICTS
jgi:hypothetical protein